MAPNPQVIMSPERLVGLAYILSFDINRRALRPLQRTMESNPLVLEQMEASGGFEAIVQEATVTPNAQSALNRLCQVQDTILTSDRFSNQNREIPTIQEETSGIGEITNIVTGIKEHLDVCCDEIKLLLRNIKIQLNDVYKDLKETINKGIKSIRLDIRLLKNDGLAFYNEELSKLKAFVPKLKQEIYNEIRSIIREETKPIKDDLEALKTKFDVLERKIDKVDRNVSSVHTTTRLVLSEFDAFIVTWDAFILTWGEYRKTYYKNHNKVMTLISSALVEINANLILETSRVNKNVKVRTRLISRNIIANTNEKYKELDGFLKDRNSGLPYIMTCEVCANIVGESYCKWDSISMYFPTLVFVFNEITNNNKPRRSQVKLRFNKTSAETTDQDIFDVINRIKSQPIVTYDYGTVKGNYVSEDKRIKTTIFGKNKETISKLLENLLNIIPERFDKELLSITDIGKKRPSITRRKKDLFNLGVNSIDYNENFVMQLKSVSILVNGIKKIIRLT